MARGICLTSLLQVAEHFLQHESQLSVQPDPQSQAEAGECEAVRRLSSLSKLLVIFLDNHCFILNIPYRLYINMLF